MSVFKVAKSPYYRYSFDIDTRRFEGSTKKRNKPDALKVEEEKREEAKKLLKAEASGAKDRDNLRPMAIETACALYHVDVMTGKPSADDVLDQLDLLSRRIGRHTLCEHIDTAEVTRIRGLRRNDIKKSGSGRGVDLVSDSTVNRDTTSLLRRVLNHVSEMHGVRLHREPIKWDKLKLKEPEGRSRELSFEEEPRLLTELEKINEYLVDPMTVSVILGQRQEPIIHLKWTEYFPLQRVIKIILKGGKVHEVPLTDEVIAIIESHRGEHTEYVFTYVCRRGGGGRNARDGIRRVKGQRYPFSKSGWAKQWRTALANAGIEDFKWHDLRHTAATRAVRVSNLAVVKKLLGHSSIQSTIRYAHAEVQDVRNAVDSLPRPQKHWKKHGNSDVANPNSLKGKA